LVDKYDLQRKMIGIEEISERNPSLVGIECGNFTFGEGKEKASFRRGEAGVSMGSRKSTRFDENNGHFSP